MKNFRLNQRSWRAVSDAAQARVAALPYELLIKRFAAVRLFLLFGLLIGALGVIMSLLYFPGDETTNGVTSRPPALETETMDEMEVWLEERQSEVERSIVAGQREYFKL